WTIWSSRKSRSSSPEGRSTASTYPVRALVRTGKRLRPYLLRTQLDEITNLASKFGRGCDFEFQLTIWSPHERSNACETCARIRCVAGSKLDGLDQLLGVRDAQRIDGLRCGCDF